MKDYHDKFRWLDRIVKPPFSKGGAPYASLSLPLWERCPERGGGLR